MWEAGMSDKLCALCVNSFTPSRRDQIYCTTLCRRRAAARREASGSAAEARNVEAHRNRVERDAAQVGAQRREEIAAALAARERAVLAEWQERNGLAI
jgi:hypothetical protein